LPPDSAHLDRVRDAAREYEAHLDHVVSLRNENPPIIELARELEATVMPAKAELVVVLEDLAAQTPERVLEEALDRVHEAVAIGLRVEPEDARIEHALEIFAPWTDAEALGVRPRHMSRRDDRGARKLLFAPKTICGARRSSSSQTAFVRFPSSTHKGLVVGFLDEREAARLYLGAEARGSRGSNPLRRGRSSIDGTTSERRLALQMRSVVPESSGARSDSPRERELRL
jgi:hypothetical protein